MVTAVFMIAHQVVAIRGEQNAVAFVYSLGPDRRRDSSARKIRVDDIGAYFIQE